MRAGYDLLLFRLAEPGEGLHGQGILRKSHGESYGQFTLFHLS